MTCIHGCDGSKIVLSIDAQRLITEELGQNCCCFVINYPHSGFHLIHEFLDLTRGKWKQQSRKATKIAGFCNIVRICRSDIPAKVVLHAPWPHDTKLECYVSCQDESTFQMVVEAVRHNVDVILAGRVCCIKYYCQRKECYDHKVDRHLSTPHPVKNDYFICEFSNETYYCECPKHKFLATITQRRGKI